MWRQFQAAEGNARMYIKYFQNHLYYEKLSSVTLYSYKTCGLSRGNCRLGKPPGKFMSSFSSCVGNHDLKWQFVHHQVLSWHSGLWHWLLQLWSWHAICLSSSWPHPTWPFLLAAKPLSFFLLDLFTKQRQCKHVLKCHKNSCLSQHFTDHKMS